jgi:FlaA1/EpsC-like NDP-sugar epimerase
LTFHGTRVLGTGEALGALAKKYEIEQVLIAIPSATGPQLVRMLQSAIDAEVDYKMVPGLADIIHGTELGKQIRDVAVEDLLGRRPVLLDEERIRERIAGKTVMVTGAVLRSAARLLDSTRLRWSDLMKPRLRCFNSTES